MKRITALILLCVFFVFIFSSCNISVNDPDTSGQTTSATQAELSLYAPSASATNFVSLDITDYGQIVIELYPDIAPQTVAHFKKLVTEGFYDGLTIHRVAKNFVIQGGDPTGTGYGATGQETIFGEFSSNGFTNNLSHKKYVVSMARKSGDNNSATSQFFICTADATSLDGAYASFGRVIYGTGIVDTLNNVSVNNQTPLKTITITSVIFVSPK